MHAHAKICLDATITKIPTNASYTILANQSYELLVGLTLTPNNYFILSH